MRKKIVAGNWKMNLDTDGVRELALGLQVQLSREEKAGVVEVAVCPPFVYLAAVAEVLAGGSINLGAQDVYFEDKGAYTGEISAAMLKDVGCRYVIVGHSERRHVIGESDELINKKIKAAINSGLLPIFCVGELLEEREASKTEDVVAAQVKKGL